MTIKNFYLENFPTDELGNEIKENVTFAGLLDALHTKGDVYEYVGVWDSLIRERLFYKLAEELNTSCGYVLDLWHTK